jgi:hypothetical protein
MSVTSGERLDNEKNVTELSIAPDGRVFAFGTSKAILEVLKALRPDDVRVCALLNHVHNLPATEGSVR